jgi:hypothetical protein
MVLALGFKIHLKVYNVTIWYPSLHTNTSYKYTSFGASAEFKPHPISKLPCTTKIITWLSRHNKEKECHQGGKQPFFCTDFIVHLPSLTFPDGGGPSGTRSLPYTSSGSHGTLKHDVYGTHSSWHFGSPAARYSRGRRAAAMPEAYIC